MAPLPFIFVAARTVEPRLLFYGSQYQLYEQMASSVGSTASNAERGHVLHLCPTYDLILQHLAPIYTPFPQFFFPPPRL